jgi:hypothetical protein
MTHRTLKFAAFAATALVCASALAVHLLPAREAASPQFVQQLAPANQAVRIEPGPLEHRDWRHAASRQAPVQVVTITGQRMSEAEKAAFDAAQGG